MSDFVHALEKFDGREILAATKLIRNPLAGFSRVVEIEHGSDGIYTQTIDMILPQPEQGIGYQEIAYLTAPKVEDQRPPLFVLAFTCIRVFIEVSAIEVAQCVTIFWKMGWNLVQEDADSLLVHVIHEILKVFRGAKAAGRRIISCGLVTPGAIIGILGDR